MRVEGRGGEERERGRGLARARRVRDREGGRGSERKKGFARSDKDEGRWRNVQGKEGERGILMKWMTEWETQTV